MSLSRREVEEDSGSEAALWRDGLLSRADDSGINVMTQNKPQAFYSFLLKHDTNEVPASRRYLSDLKMIE